MKLDPEFEKKRAKTPLPFKEIQSDNLDCEYGLVYSREEALDLLQRCEEELSYFTGQLSKVFVFGKWHDIPRKQVRMD